MKRTWTFDLSEFNAACKEMGFPPYPAKAIKFDIQDEHHLKLSVRGIQTRLEKWLAECQKTK